MLCQFMFLPCLCRVSPKACLKLLSPARVIILCKQFRKLAHHTSRRADMRVPAIEEPHIAGEDPFDGMCIRFVRCNVQCL